MLQLYVASALSLFLETSNKMVELRDDPKIIFGENYSLNYKHKITQQKLHQEISGGLLEETFVNVL